jgi:hypothetical protein
VSLYTRTELERIYRRLDAGQVFRKSAEVLLGEASAKAAPTVAYDIFLSHSYLDARHVLALKEDMGAMGFSVYVDWIEDQDLARDKVTRETARRLRGRMKQCAALLFASSSHSRTSSWMPWELGYFDGMKGRVAVLPVLQVDVFTDRFHGQEYLGLYPYVTKDQAWDRPATLWVREGSAPPVRLKDWLVSALPRTA